MNGKMNGKVDAEALEGRRVGYPATCSCGSLCHETE